MTKLRNVFMAVLGTLFFGLALASPASAEPAPSVEDAITSGFGDMTSLITTTLVPLLFGIVIVGLGIALGVKWLRKGAKSA